MIATAVPRPIRAAAAAGASGVNLDVANLRQENPESPGK
jgi:hypothetical protein